MLWNDVEQVHNVLIKQDLFDNKLIIYIFGNMFIVILHCEYICIYTIDVTLSCKPANIL